MIKKIRDWYNKRQEKKLLDWISTHDIRYYKYEYLLSKRMFYNQELLNEFTYADITNIDDYIYGFIEDGGQLVYAYDKDIYQKVKELKKQCIPYCFTENQYETKLNYLIEKKSDFYDIWKDSALWNNLNSPVIINKINKKEWIEGLECLYLDNHKYLWVGSKTLEKDIEKCKQKDIEYKLTIQKELIKEFKKYKYDIQKQREKHLIETINDNFILLFIKDVNLQQKVKNIKNIHKRYALVYDKKYLKFNTKA